MAATLLETLVSYVPRALLRHRIDHPEPLVEPVREVFTGALVLADVSGFTRMTEVLAHKGPAGAEELVAQLNAFFGPLIDLIDGAGGDILKFAGDALLVAWTEPDDERAIARAARCALAMHHLPPLPGGPVLRLRVAVGAGEFALAQVGGERGRWETVVTGRPLEDLGPVLHAIEPGQVALTAAAWAALGDAVRGMAVDGGFRLDGLAGPPAAYRMAVPEVPPSLVPELQGYLPGAVRARLAADQARWLAELRGVTVLFVNLPGVHHATPLAATHELVRTLQQLVYRFEGSLNKLSVDEKGVSMLVVLGLPPVSHEDDPLRGARLGLALLEAMTERGRSCSIGMATGRVFCGEVGNACRREYTLMGDTVNLAARLMQAAAGGVLADAATIQAAGARLAHEPLGLLELKGKAQPVAIFRPLGAGSARHRQIEGSLVGRAAEWQVLASELAQLGAGGPGGTIVVAGEPGIGKSRLVAELAAAAPGAGVVVWQAQAEAIEQHTPYHAWLPLLAQLGAPARMVEELEHEPTLPLLNAMWPLDLPETERTRGLAPQIRSEQLAALVVGWLRRCQAGRPTLVILEDAHWCDSASWQLALRLQQGLDRPLVVVATRPLVEPVPEGYRELAARAAHCLELGMMADAEALELVRRRLAIAELPDAVAAWICERAAGHPYFCEELAHALREGGMLEEVGGTWRLAVEPGLLRLPDSIQGLITSRIDRLEPVPQLAIKVASVIGRCFSLATLRDVYPVAQDRPSLPAHVETLQRLDLTPQDPSLVEPAYLFKHRITQEVAYGMMLVTQRQAMHAEVATWYEERQAQGMPVPPEVLAYHREHAGQPDRAARHLERAGDDAHAAFAYREACRHYRRAIALAPEVGRERAELRAGRLGRCLVTLGQVDEGVTQLEAALAWSGAPAPARGLGPVAFLREAGRLLRQLVRSGLGMSPPPVVGLAAARLRQQASLLMELSDAYYYRNEPYRSGSALLQAVMRADRAGPSPELALAFAGLGVLGVLLPGRAAVHHFRTRAHAASTGAPAAIRAQVALRASLPLTGTAMWQEARAEAEAALTACLALGDWKQANMARTVLAEVARLGGDDAAQLLHAEALCATGVAHHDPQSQLHGLVYLGWLARRSGSRQELSRVLEQAWPLLAGSGERLLEARLQALQLATGATPEALAPCMGELAALARTARPSGAELGFAFAAALEAGLRLREQVDPAHRALWDGWAAELAAGLELHARYFAVLQPAAWRLRGRLAWLAGRHGAARASWRRARARARELGLTVEVDAAGWDLAWSRGAR